MNFRTTRKTAFDPGPTSGLNQGEGIRWPGVSGRFNLSSALKKATRQLVRGRAVVGLVNS